MGIVALLLAVVGGMVILRNGSFRVDEQPAGKLSQSPSFFANTMQIMSAAFAHNQLIPARYTCDGDDMSPPLTISGVPDGTKSLALIVDDPDAPAGTWDHWIVFNIPPDTHEILEGSEPRGVHGKGTSGNLEYHGPCPPDREHRYFFKVYALDTMLELSEGASKAELEQAMQGSILDQAELIGRYARGR